MSNFELEFYDRLQYWHRLEEKVVRIMKKRVRSECRVQNFKLSGGKQGTWMICKTKCGFIRARHPKSYIVSLSVLA